MTRFAVLVASVAAVLALHSAYAGDSTDETRSEKSLVGDDPRQLVSMPDGASRLLREHMRDHLSALNEIIGHLANDDLEAVAETAENRLGNSSRGRHRGSGMGPGKHMPPGMRQIGRGMHRSASELSLAAAEGDLKGVYSTLQEITGACVACHNGYRIR